MEIPKQARSLETLEKIMGACDALLAKKTIEQISMQEIATEAGVSVGNLYNRFKDRDALIHHVIERHQLAFRQSLVDQLNEQSMTLEERLIKLTEIFARALAPLQPIFTTLAIRFNQGVNPDIDVQSSTDEIVDVMVDWLLQSRDEMSGEDPRPRCTFVVSSIGYNLQYDLLLKTPSRMFGQQFSKLLAQQAHSYLTQQRALI